MELAVRRELAMIRARVTAALAVACLSACDGPTQAAEKALVIRGHAEQGAPVEFFVSDGFTDTPVQQAAISFSPADIASASFTGNNFVWQHAGPVTVTATVDGVTYPLALTIAEPPLIVFDMAVAGNRDIYEARLDGSGLTRLTTNPADDAHPAEAGGTVVFASIRGGNWDLFSLERSSGAEVNLTSTPGVNETEPSMSPGGALVYVRDDGVPRVWTSSRDGSAASALTAAFGSSASVEASPQWSPAGDSIVFMSTANGNAAIFAARIGSAAAPNAYVVASPDSVFIEPTWTRGGSTIAFAAAPVGGSSRIAVRSPGATTKTFVTPASLNASQPMYLTDGRLVFTVSSGNATSLMWVDPKWPETIVTVPLAGNPQHASLVR